MLIRLEQVPRLLALVLFAKGGRVPDMSLTEK